MGLTHEPIVHFVDENHFVICHGIAAYQSKEGSHQDNHARHYQHKHIVHQLVHNKTNQF